MAGMATPTQRDGLSITLFLAAALHAILVLGLGFSALEGDNSHPPQLEVTLAQIRSDSVPVDADHLAQHDQLGSGDEAEHSRLASARPLPAESGRREAQTALDPQQRRDRQVLQTRSSDWRQADTTERVSMAEELAPGRQGIARLASQTPPSMIEAPEETEFAEASRAPRVRQITAVSARAAEDAAYLHDWERRVESVGNQFYPEASIRYGLYGSLRLLVAIDRRGQLLEARVLATSGHAVLDEAAIKIVRMAAPFAPFPPALSATTDRLEIIRTWHFQENRLSSG